MKAIRSLTVMPSLPPRLERLRDLAYNLRWAWNHQTIELFRRLDSDLWETSGHNPVLMLGAIRQAQLDTAAADEAFLAELDRVSQEFDAYVAGKSTWYTRTYGPADFNHPLVAYFSAEFGLTECLSIFAGGLGLLAGDHLKSASDLGLPLVGVGLLYQQGYFRQYLNSSGWQQEVYADNDFYNLPLFFERQSDGTPLTITVAYPGRPVVAQVWRAQVGRLSLYLLDANLPINNPADRAITAQLYGGDQEMRIQQEILLGIGGVRALVALGLEAQVYHMNEGHAAFLSLERIRQLMAQYHLSFAEARQAASAALIFTTHTPVPAGHDRFPPSLMDRYFTDYTAGLGLSRRDFLGLGRQNPADDNETFSMTVLALRMAAYSNGVSKLHGAVSRRMFTGLWPGVPEDEIPIGHVTNGVHYLSWVSREMADLYDRYLGPWWRDRPADQTVWHHVERIPAEELWRNHERRRERLIAFARQRLRSQLERRGAPQREIETGAEALDPEALTIGFARRFATYKRATLLIRDQDRLARILNDPERPVQVIFAGKAHPRDDAGKELIRQIVEVARQDRFRRRMVFLEDYDTAIARYMVQGCDVWLNNPRRPLEASGTSGMKAAANGVLNLSTLDGWWDEVWHDFGPRPEPEETLLNPRVVARLGWAIGRGESYADLDYQDRVEAEALYNILEQDVVPTFYAREADGLPRRWIASMKTSVGTLGPFFNTNRMVHDYAERFYLPASTRYQQLMADALAHARALAAWEARLQAEWGNVRIRSVQLAAAGPTSGPPRVGDPIHAQAVVRLAKLTPDDVAVQLYLGRLNAQGDITEAAAVPMVAASQDQPGDYCFESESATFAMSGRVGYSVRVLPRHPDLPTPFLPGLIVWAQDSGSK